MFLKLMRIGFLTIGKITHLSVEDTFAIWKQTIVLSVIVWNTTLHKNVWMITFLFRLTSYEIQRYIIIFREIDSFWRGFRWRFRNGSWWAVTAWWFIERYPDQINNCWIFFSIKNIAIMDMRSQITWENCVRL